MDEAVRERLLALNRAFYTAVATPFDETRRGWTPGKTRLLTYLPVAPHGRPIRIADVGCGNGRFALMLQSLDTAFHYVGVDGNSSLLAMAREQSRALNHVATTYVQADLAMPDWIERLDGAEPFDVVVCLATLQHLPGTNLRRRVLRELAALVKPDGLVAVSAWQFLSSPRFRERLLDWHEVGLREEDVEAGDGLLPWKQGVYATRYVHQIDEEEMTGLVSGTGLSIRETFYADGKEGNLNLYAIMDKDHYG